MLAVSCAMSPSSRLKSDTTLMIKAEGGIDSRFLSAFRAGLFSGAIRDAGAGVPRGTAGGVAAVRAPVVAFVAGGGAASVIPPDDSRDTPPCDVRARGAAVAGGAGA